MSDRMAVLVEGSKAQYRASAAGMCVRALAGLRMGMDPLPPTEDMKRRFADGHLHEDSILETVERELNQAVVRRQEEWQIDISSRVTVVGHVDGITSDDLLPVEAKSASKESFKDWERGPEQWFKAHPTYGDQWTLTLSAYQRVTGIYAVKNKDSGLVIWRDILAPETLQEVKVRLLRADLDGRRGKLPECDRLSWGCPLRYLHDEKEEIEQDETLIGLCQSYMEAKERVDQAEAVRKELGLRIADAMGDRDKIKAGAYQVSMVSWTRTALDREKLLAAVEDLTPFEKVSSGVYARVTGSKNESSADG